MPQSIVSYRSDSFLLLLMTETPWEWSCVSCPILKENLARENTIKKTVNTNLTTPIFIMFSFQGVRST